MDSPAATALTLVVEKGPRKGETMECRPHGRVQIGRVVKGNTFTIKDAGISQAHLSIEAPAGGAGWAVTDLGSSNGTLLNGVRIEPSAPAAVHDGDVIKIGEETSIRVRIAEAEASAPRLRRNPRRGCAVVAAETPGEETGGGARGRGRPRKGRGRGAPKKAAAAPRCLHSVSEESEKEYSEVMENKVLKEVKQDISDSVHIVGVKGSKAGVSRGTEAPRKAASTVGAPEAEQVRVEDEMGVPLRQVEGEEDVAGANPGVEEGSVDMDNMTLDEWFDRMEKYLPKVINEIADKVIAEIKAKAERFNEYVGSLDSER